MELKAFAPNVAIPRQAIVPRAQAARAPYNFVPYPDAVVVTPVGRVPMHDEYRSDLLTGRIECVLTTKTPTYVRCAWSPEDFRKLQKENLQDTKSLPWAQEAELKRHDPEFFNHGDPRAPWIPGSTLRGYLRSIFRIVTFSRPEEPGTRVLSVRGIGDKRLQIWYHEQVQFNTISLSLEERATERAMQTAGLRRDRIRRYKSEVKAGFIHRDPSDPRRHLIRPAGLGGEFYRLETKDAEPLAKKFAPGKTRPHVTPVWFLPAEIEPHPHGKKWAPDHTRWPTLLLEYAKLNGALVRLREDGDVPQPGERSGLLVWTGMSPRKHLQYVFPTMGSTVPPLEVRADHVKELVEVMRKSVPVKKEDPDPRSIFENDSIKDGTPIFYTTKGQGPHLEVDRIGWTQMFRVAYRSQFPRDFLPKYVVTGERVDLGDAVFGWAGGKSGSRRGRIRVGSARLAGKQENILLDVVEPAILGQPKPSCFPHYLTQPLGSRVHYGDPRRSPLRGVKRYWPRADSRGVPAGATFEEQRRRAAAKQRQQHQHGGEVPLQPPAQDQASPWTQFQPVRGGVGFQFSIAFENLHKEELGAILYALKPTKATEAWPDPLTVRHTIGMGKPLGFGTVTIEPQLILERRSSEAGAGRYEKLFDGAAWHLPTHPQTNANDCVEAFLTSMRMAVGSDIRSSSVMCALIELTRQTKAYDYMPLSDPGNRPREDRPNEPAYKDRSVLPAPQDVGQ